MTLFCIAFSLHVDVTDETLAFFYLGMQYFCFQLPFIVLCPDTWQGAIWGRKGLILALSSRGHSTAVRNSRHGDMNGRPSVTSICPRSRVWKGSGFGQWSLKAGHLWPASSKRTCVLSLHNFLKQYHQLGAKGLLNTWAFGGTIFMQTTAFCYFDQGIAWKKCSWMM